MKLGDGIDEEDGEIWVQPIENVSTESFGIIKLGAYLNKNYKQ